MNYLWGKLTKLQAILLTVALVLIAYLIALLSVRGGTQPLRSVERLSTYNIEGMQINGSNIYYLDSGSLHCVNSKGDYQWNLGVDNGARFSVNDNGIALWSGKSLYTIDPKTGVTGVTGIMSDIITSAMVGEKYIVAVIEPEDNPSIVIMDRYMNNVDTITGLNNQTVLDYGFFEGQSLFWLLTLDSTGSEPTCTVATYRPGRQMTGAISEMEQVLYDIQFRSSYICAVGTNYIKVFNYKGNEQTDQRVTVFGYTLEASNGIKENPLMVFAPNYSDVDAPFINDIRCIRGKSDKHYHLPIKCLSVEARGNYVYGFSTDAVAVVNFDNDTVNTYQLPIMIDGVIGVTDDYTAVVTYANSVCLIKLSDK